MKEFKLTVQINRPTKDVFAFTLDPKNTPKWIDFIAVEQANEWPPKVGTIYRNQNTAGEWREFELTALRPDKEFVLSTKGGFHVRYGFTPLTTTATEMEYSEWLDNGDVGDGGLTMDALEKLKREVEAIPAN